MATVNYYPAQSSGTGSGGTVYVGTAAALAALDVSTYTEGQDFYVASLRATFDLMLSGAATKALVRIDAFGKAGYQLVRRIVRNPYWEAQTVWSVDCQNSTGFASDENTGLDFAAGGPLLTFEELSRRIAFAVSGTITITFRGNQQAGDDPVWTNNSKQGTFVFLTGTKTTLYSGTVGVSTPLTLATAAADEATITDASISGGSFTAAGALGQGVFLRRTNGTELRCHALSDLGTKTLRISQPVQSTVPTTTLNFANSDTYDIEQYPQLTSMRFADNGRLIGWFIQDVDWRATGYMPSIFFRNCYFSTITNNFNVLGGLFQNCCFDTGGSTFLGSGLTTFTSATFKGTGATTYSLYRGVYNSEGGVMQFQGANLSVGGGTLDSTNLHFYDTTTYMIFGDTGGLVHLLAVGGVFGGVVNGKGNTGKLCTMTQGSRLLSGTVTIANMYVAGITTDATPIGASGAYGVGQILLDAKGNGVFVTS